MIRYNSKNAFCDINVNKRDIYSQELISLIIYQNSGIALNEYESLYRIIEYSNI